MVVITILSEILKGSTSGTTRTGQKAVVSRAW